MPPKPASGIGGIPLIGHARIAPTTGHAPMDLPGFLRRLWFTALAVSVLLVPLTAWLALRTTMEQSLSDLRRAYSDRAALYAAHLQAAMEKHGEIPLALSHDEEMRQVLDEPKNARLIRHVSDKLKQLAGAAGAVTIYLMDQNGLVVASSNYDEPGSFVGRHTGTHHVYTAGLTAGAKRYFAAGAISNIPGYFIAYPVDSGRGVVELKVNIDDLEQVWQFSPEIMLVTDRHGVVFMTNVPQWHFRAQEPLSPALFQELFEQQQYGDRVLTRLPVLSRQDDIWTVRDAEGNPRQYLALSRPLSDSHWNIWMLSDLSAQFYRSETVAIFAALIAFILMLVITLYIQRRASARYRYRLQKQWNEDLERQIRARSAELEQAARLAALGQMSAGVAHEVNQPLTAIRAFADNGRRFIALGRIEQADQNLQEIVDQADRLRVISDQLRAFARRPSEDLKPIDLRQALEASLRLFAERIRHDRVEVRLPAPDPARPVRAENVRLQQILVNLISNALDAMRASRPRILAFEFAAASAAMTLHVRDSGPGIPEEELDSIFEPFVTHKTPGEGLGLGLPISRSIAADFGGQLQARNHAQGGAEFSLTLNLAD
jgi:two-component system C4-dicarboxylate transport sensor histidine kinase DctB